MIIRNLTEMARVGWIPVGSENSVEVYVRTDDGGMTPHFHVRKYSGSNRPEWETCIKYESADYFLHGKYRDRFPNTKLAKGLDKLFRTLNKDDPGRTYWQTAIIAWNLNNSTRKLPFDLEQPDYTKL